MSLVSFVNIKNDTKESFKTALLKSLNLINYSFDKDIKNIVIKPNMCYYWDYSTGETTDPVFIGALIDVIRENFSDKTKISLIEADASAMKCKHAFKMLGYEKLASDYDVDLVNLSEDDFTPVESEAGGFNLKFNMPKTIQNADLKINVPKIKYTVPKLKLTCALKNLFGCLPYPKKYKYHPKIGEVIVALNKAFRFNLCIIDGNIVSGVSACRLGLVMASKDSVAMDAACAKIAGINPKSINYLQLAAREGLGTTNFVERGVPLNYFSSRYPRKGIESKLMRKAYDAVNTLGLGKKLGL